MVPKDLLQTAWVLASVNGEPQPATPRRTLAFVNANEYSGFAGCRHFVGSYQAQGDTLDIFTMRMFGPDCAGSSVLTEQEGQYTDWISGAEQYLLQAGRLDVRTAPGDTLAFLPVQQTAPLEGTEWRLVAWMDTAVPQDVERRRASDVLPNSEITLRLEDGRAVGQAGCNRYNASYTVDASEIAFGPAGTTKMFCAQPEGVMAQESAFLNLLAGVTRYQVIDDQLWLETGGWPGLVFARGE